MRDYRENQFRRNWWDQKVPYMFGMTRNDLVLVVVGIIIATIYIEFINWDWVFGLR